MVKNRHSRDLRPPEKCPDCGADIWLRPERVGGESQLKMFNADGSYHICRGKVSNFEEYPIGKIVKGKKITGFELRGRVLTITLEDGNIFFVSAAGRPLTIQLKGPDGVLQE